MNYVNSFFFFFRIDKLQEILFFQQILFFYKQVGSGLSPQICLYFQGFRGSKLLNDCLIV